MLICKAPTNAAPFLFGQPMRASSNHIGIIGGLGVGAPLIYYEQIAAKCAARGIIRA